MKPTTEVIPDEIIPDAWRTTVSATPTGTVVIRQEGEASEAMVLVPRQFVRAFCDAVFRASGHNSGMDDIYRTLVKP